jgi:transcriptional regulator with XRE-family HTH domain
MTDAARTFVRKPRSRKPTLGLDDIARERVREWMAVRGWNQSALAARLGRTKTWVSRYLQGGFSLEFWEAGELARAFEQPIEALVISRPDDPVWAARIAKFDALPEHERQLVDRLIDAFSRPPDIGPERRGRRRSRV